ncbi:MAG TPA: hypothetical protein VM733_10790 [Thermoanaerobaculia bacterium]|nr:hypothetical protein [Thermoanaerobaculia bacterium]
MIPALFLAISLGAAVVPGPERAVTAVAPSPSGGDVFDAATDGRRFLTLWYDRTAGREGLYASVADERGVPVSGASELLASGYAYAQVVWTGDHYLVLFALQPGVQSLLLDRDGHRISGPSPIDVAEARVASALAWNGSVALATVSTPAGMRGVILGANGEVLRSNIVFPGSVSFWDVTLTAAGSSFILVWTEPSGQKTRVQTMRIASDGTASGPMTLVSERSGIMLLDSASSGNRAGVTVTSGSANFWRIFAFTFDAASDVAQSHAPVDIVTYSTDVDVVVTPSGFAATYFTFDRSTAILNTLPFDSTTPHTLSLGAFSGLAHEVTANAHAAMIVAGGAPVLATMLDPTLTRRTNDGSAIALAPAAWQAAPAIAPGGSNVLVTWIEPAHLSRGRVMARRFDRAGNALDAQALLLGDEASPRRAPAVAFTGKMWLVVWQQAESNDSHVLMRRIAPDGALLDAAPIDLGLAFEPIAASNGSVTAIVLADFRNSDMTIARYNADGERIDATTFAANASGGRSYYRGIVTNGSEFLIVWSAEYNAILGRRLDASGASTDAAPIAIAAGPDVESEPHVASDGTDFLVLYTQNVQPDRGDPPSPDAEPPIPYVRSKRVLRNGALADFTAAQDGNLIGRGLHPRVAWNGSRYVATFVGDEMVYPLEGPQPLTLYAAPLDARGALSAETRTVVRAEWTPNLHALAAVGAGAWTAYSRVVPELGNVQRVFTRTLFEEYTRRRTSRK